MSDCTVNTKLYIPFQIVVAQLLSHVWLFETPWTIAYQASLYFTISWICSNSCSLSRWCYLTISSSAVHLSFCHQSSPASGSFPMSWLFASGGHSIGASASVLPMNIQGWFPLGLTGLISLQSRWLLWIFPRTTIWKYQFFGTQPSLWSNSHMWLSYMTTGKIIALTGWIFVGKVMSLLINNTSRFVIALLPRSKHLLISWLQWFWSPRK